MDEETAIIANNTRNEKIRNFFTNNKKILITLVSTVIVLIIGYFAFAEYEEKKKLKISDQYNSIVTEYTYKDKETTTNILIELIKKKDSTYSPLSLYFIIDNQLISDELIINNLFDIIIEDVYLKKEIKNLIIYKKALYNADNSTEYEILETLKPIINTNSVWKSHALYLIGEYFYSKNEKQKAKEFFIQIISLKNANQEIKTESQKRLNRDLSE